MDNRLLLVKAITLLYRESQLPNNTTNSADLVRTVLDGIKVSEVVMGVNSEREIIVALKDTALDMCKNPPDFSYDKDILLQRLLVNTMHDEKLYDAFVHGVEADLEEKAIKRVILSIQKSLSNHFKEQKIGSILSSASYKFNHQRETIKDTQQFLMEINAQLEPLQMETNTKDPAIVEEINVSDTSNVERIFTEVKNKDNGNTLLKTGWKRLNHVLQGGFRRGQSVVIGALQHKFKTGFTLNLFRQIALYNKPVMLDPSKKPLLLRISFEDEMEDNLKFLCTGIKENESFKKETLEDMTVAEMAAYNKEKLGVNGYEVIMLRVNPSLWTYKHVTNKVIEYEAQGFEVHLLMLDYLSMLPLTGCEGSGGSEQIRDMFRRLRNFCAPKKIAFITPHQLSTEAKQLIRDGRQDFVKEVNERGYYSGSKQIDQEVDLELIIHIEKANDGTSKRKKSYLTIQRGKHRAVPVLAEEDKYFVLEFGDYNSGILDDINGEDSSLKKVGGKKGQEDEHDLFDFSPSITL